MLKVLKALRMCGKMLTFKCRRTGRLTFARMQMKWAGAVCGIRPFSALLAVCAPLLDH